VSYFALKTVHLLLFSLFLGAGFASVFYKLMADRTGNTRIIAATMRHLVIADLAFTVPSVIGLPFTGLAMLGWEFSMPWVRIALVLYCLAGIPWLIAVKLQYDMRRLACEAEKQVSPLSAEYFRKTKIWAMLGVPSFAFALLLVYVMVNKHLPWF